MSTAAQSHANRTNAQASTGPSTPEGKAASSRNATTHGLSSANFSLLPGEDPEAYRTDLTRHCEIFRPANRHELYLVELMVQSLWKQARAQRMESALVVQMMNADPDNQSAEAVVASALLNGTAGPFKTLQRYQAAAEKSYFKALAELERYRRTAELAQPIAADSAPQSRPENTRVRNEPNSAAPPPAPSSTDDPLKPPMAAAAGQSPGQPRGQTAA